MRAYCFCNRAEGPSQGRHLARVVNAFPHIQYLRVKDTINIAPASWVHLQRLPRLAAILLPHARCALSSNVGSTHFFATSRSLLFSTAYTACSHTYTMILPLC